MELFQFIPWVLIIIASFWIIRSTPLPGQKLSKLTVALLWVVSVAVPGILQGVVVDSFAPTLQVTDFHRFLMDSFNMQLGTADYIVDFFWRAIGVIIAIFVVKAAFLILIRTTNKIKYALVNKFSVQYGSLLGVVLLALSIFSFYFITKIVQSQLIFLITPVFFSLLPIALVIIFCFNERKKIGGYWNFKQATTGIFIMCLTAFVIQTVGVDLIFEKFIEPNMAYKTQAATITIMMKKEQIDQKQIDEKITDLKNNLDNQKNNVIDIIRIKTLQIILLFVLAIIFGALFKRNEPIPAQPIDAEQV